MYFHLHEEGNKVELAMNLSKVFTITEKAFGHYVNQIALSVIVKTSQRLVASSIANCVDTWSCVGFNVKLNSTKDSVWNVKLCYEPESCRLCRLEAPTINLHLANRSSKWRPTSCNIHSKALEYNTWFNPNILARNWHWHKTENLLLMHCIV